MAPDYLFRTYFRNSTGKSRYSYAKKAAIATSVPMDTTLMAHDSPKMIAPVSLNNRFEAFTNGSIWSCISTISRSSWQYTGCATFVRL